MKETYVKWEPVEGLSEKYYIDAVLDRIGGFTIELSDADDRKKKLRVVFEESIEAYRFTDKSLRVQTIVDLNKMYPDPWSFFKVTNSTYIEWILEQTLGISDSMKFMHFSFIGSDSVLDVITNYEPKVELTQ